MTAQQRQAYAALSVAAERIGRANYRAGLYRVQRNRRGRVVAGYSLTAAHAEVVAAMPRVASGELSPNDAMALLHTYDVERERLAG